MQPRLPTQTQDRPCPLVFLVATAFASSIVWLGMLLGRLAVR